jgi:hypothetical protein
MPPRPISPLDPVALNLGSERSRGDLERRRQLLPDDRPAIPKGTGSGEARSLSATFRLSPHVLGEVDDALKLNGYSTAEFGKCHEVTVWQTSPTGPFGA